MGYNKFCKTTTDTLNSYAPVKKKYAPSNQNLSKEIMTSLRLGYEYLKHKTEEIRFLHTQQRNERISLLRKTKINYYGNLDEKGIADKFFFENC